MIISARSAHRSIRLGRFQPVSAARHFTTLSLERAPPSVMTFRRSISSRLRCCGVNSFPHRLFINLPPLRLVRPPCPSSTRLLPLRSPHLRSTGFFLGQPPPVPRAPASIYPETESPSHP